MASLGIGAKLRKERVGKGLAIDDISRDTRIAPRFLEAIETDDYSSLPGLVFTRNFVRQYALTLELDPDPLLAELPKPDETTAPLPNPPARPRSSYHRNRRRRSLVVSIVWLAVAGAGVASYMRFDRLRHAFAPKAHPAQPAASPALPGTDVVQTAPAETRATAQQSIQLATATAPVQVSLTTHDESAWVQVSADGKIKFIGTLQPNETRDVSAEEQVGIVTGNAGALTISLNGKTLASIGPHGQVREVRLTAEGPRLLTKAPPPAPDPL